MTKICTACFSLVLAVSTIIQAEGFDRAAEHVRRIDGYSESRRSTISSDNRSASLQASAFGDLLVSDYGYPARFTQDHVRLLPISNGRWLAAWSDDRLGASKIFWQVLDSLGVSAGSNQMIAGSAVGNDYVDPLLLKDSRGKIYLLFRDQSAGEVYTARFNADLSVDLSAKLINDTALGGYAGPFSAALFADNRMAVVWENYGPSSQSISYCIFDSSMNLQMSPSTAPSDLGTTQKWVPSIAIDPATGFVVAWEDYRNGNADIFARQFDGAGTPVGSDFSVVPSPAADQPQYAPQIAFCGADKYVFGWLDRRLGQEVYIQQFNPTSGLIGVNRLVSIADTLTTNWDLNLSTTPAGTLCASWGAFGASNTIYSARYAAGLALIGTPSGRNLTSIGRRWSPSTSFATNKRYAMAWTEFQSEDANIDLMIFDTAATRRLANERVVNDDQIGSPAFRPSLAASSDWYELVVFESRRRDAGDIYCQAVSVTGVIPEHNQLVNQDSGANLQSEPHVCAASNKALVTWIDSRPLAGIAGQRIFARFGGPSGLFTTNEFCISDTSQAAVKSQPHGAMAVSGRALVSWFDKRSGILQVWGRWLSTSGALDGAEFQISNSISDLQNDRLMASCDTLGRFFVTWLDRNGATPTVKCRWYNADKSAGGTWSWAPGLGSTIHTIATTNFPSGNVGIIWAGVVGPFPAGEWLSLAVVTPTGTVARQIYDIASSPYVEPKDLSISIDNGGWVSTVWIDNRNGFRQAFYQLNDPTLDMTTGALPISSATPEFMTQPVTHASRGRTWFAWVDPRADGLQVYASNLATVPTDVDDPDDNLPADFALEQNYPNPFNPSTTIEFSLPKSSSVTLEVFNLLGQSVSTLADGEQYPAGTHKLVWDGRDATGESVASGVYFYRLTTDEFTQQKKMVLLK